MAASPAERGQASVAILPPLRAGFPSGQRGRAVNPLAQPSQVRILPPPLPSWSGTGRRRRRRPTTRSRSSGVKRNATSVGRPQRSVLSTIGSGSAAPRAGGRHDADRQREPSSTTASTRSRPSGGALALGEEAQRRVLEPDAHRRGRGRAAGGSLSEAPCLSRRRGTARCRDDRGAAVQVQEPALSRSPPGCRHVVGDVEPGQERLLRRSRSARLGGGCSGPPASATAARTASGDARRRR